MKVTIEGLCQKSAAHQERASMPNITMCKNKLCPSKDTCYRFTATPDKYLQAWADFKPFNPWEDKCGWYVEDEMNLEDDE
jgi:hypothetical protein